ncbi:MAG: type II secretion system F family protein [Patescibacteria group bacterium]
MPLYSYKAVDKNGSPTSGEILADSREEAVENLSRDGLLPIIVEEKSVGKLSQFSDLAQFFPFFQKIGAIDKILLTRYLAAILKAGIGLAEALEIILNDAKKPLIRKILLEIKAGVERGEPLSSMFADYPRYFSPIFVGMIKAGELSGSLESALENLSGQLIRDYDLLKRVRMAMIYPLILLIGSAGIIVLMMTFVLPRMAKAFKGMLAELPLITRFFIALSDYLSRSPILTISVFFILIAAGFYFSRSVFGKKIIFRVFEKLPVASELVKKLALARFSRTFKNLLGSGVSAIEAIEMSALTVGNPTYQKSFLNIMEELKKGSNFSAVFKSRPALYPSFFANIIAIGERTGTLEKSLETLSAFYEEEVDGLLKNLVSLLEPLLIFAMGIIVAMVALSVLLPIFRMVRMFQ